MFEWRARNAHCCVHFFFWQEIHLKYLDFFRLIVLRATTYVATIYEYAKESSGPLKPGVDSVEGTVKTVVGPVYKQFHSKPAEFLQFVDSKVSFVRMC